MGSILVNSEDMQIEGFLGEEINVPFYLQFVPGYVTDVVTSAKSLKYGNNMRNINGGRLAKIVKWSNYVLDYMYNTNINNNILSDSTKEYIETMDKLNGTKFLEVYPEFEEYWQ